MSMMVALRSGTLPVRVRRRLDLVVVAVRPGRADPGMEVAFPSSDHLTLVVPRTSFLRDGQQPLGPGEALVVAPGTAVALTASIHAEWLELRFGGGFISDLSAALPRRASVDRQVLDAQVQTMLQPDPVAATRTAARLVLGLAVGEVAPAPGVPMAAAARSLVRLAGAREVDVRRVADLVGTSVSHLHRLYQRHFGISPLRDARRHLMAQAQVALRHTTISCQELAGVLGYDDPLYFSAVFRRVVGRSPRAWRQQATAERELARA